MFKLTLKIILLVTLIIILIIVGISSGVINISKIESTKNPELLSEIKDIGNLQVTKFSVNCTLEDTVKNDSLVAFKLPVDRKIFLIINGEVDACISLNGIGKEDVKENNDTIYILLPEPFLCNTKINYKQSKIYDANFNSHYVDQDVLEKIFPGAGNNLKAEAIRIGILDQAKENTRKILSILISNESKNKIIFEFKE